MHSMPPVILHDCVPTLNPRSAKRYTAWGWFKSDICLLWTAPCCARSPSLILSRCTLQGREVKLNLGVHMGSESLMAHRRQVDAPKYRGRAARCQVSYHDGAVWIFVRTFHQNKGRVRLCPLFFLKGKDNEKTNLWSNRGFRRERYI